MHKKVNTPGGFQVLLEFFLFGALAAAGAFDLDVDGAAVLDGLQVGQAGIAAQALQVVENEPALPLQEFLDLGADFRFCGGGGFSLFIAGRQRKHPPP